MYGRRICIAISVLINVILGGYSNQTFSARNYCWKSRNLPNLVWLIDFFFYLDEDHCKKSYEFWIQIKIHHHDLCQFR